MKGCLSNDFIQYKLQKQQAEHHNREGKKERKKDRTIPDSQREHEQKSEGGTINLHLDFNTYYEKENQERKKALMEQQSLIKNYFQSLVSGEAATERIRLLSSKYKLKKI